MHDKPNQVATLPTNNPPNPHSALTAFAEHLPSGNRQSVFGLVEAISSENQILKGQQQSVECELQKLKKISQGLLGENRQLRNLYRERSLDISKLLSSIGINTNEAVLDYQHQQFLMKELNCSILKQIKLVAQQIQTLAQGILKDQRECSDLNQSRVKLEQHILNKIKIKLSSHLQSSKLEQEKRRQIQEIEAANQISSEVIDLSLQIKQLQAIRNSHNQNACGLYNSLQNEKVQWAAQLKQIRAENSKYRHEISSDQSNLERISEDLKSKQARHETVKSSLNEQIKRKEKYLRISQQCAELSQKIKEKASQSKKRISIWQGKLDEVRQKKNEMMEKINQVKSRIQSQQKAHQSKVQQIENSKQKQIRAYKTAISASDN